MNCPNDRYVNDSAICQAVAANLARIGVKINLQAETKVSYFPKILRRDTSFYLLGWTPSTVDSHDVLSSIMATPNDKGQGQFNLGAYSNPKLDELTLKIQSETDQKKRNDMIREAFKIHQDDVGHIPLHQQALAWATSKKVELTQLPNNYMYFKWITLEVEVGDAASLAPAGGDARRRGATWLPTPPVAPAPGRWARFLDGDFWHSFRSSPIGDRRGRGRAALRRRGGVRQRHRAAQSLRSGDARAERLDAAARRGCRAARPSTCSAPTSRAATCSRR